MTQPSTKVTLLVNPVTRRVQRKFDAEGAHRYLGKRGIDCRLEIPDSERALVAVARQAAERGDDLLFIAGGDGTLRLAAGAIADSDTALAALPGGTANVWCKEARIPNKFRAAVDAHINGQTVSMDLGLAGEEPFLLMVGIGWDAAITGSVNSRLKRATGPAAYGIRGLRMLPGLKTQRMEWSDDSGVHAEDCGLIVVSNTRLYGGIVRFSPQAAANDGLLDICAVVPDGRGSGIRLVGALARGKLSSDSGATTYQTRSIDVTTACLPMQLDGDALGETPVTISVRPKALRVRVPAGALPRSLQET